MTIKCGQNNATFFGLPFVKRDRGTGRRVGGGYVRSEQNETELC